MEEEKAQQKDANPTEAKKPEASKQEAPKKAQKIKLANCANCNKVLKKRNWYYRDGKRYCNKPCWKAAKAKAAAKKEETPAQT